MTSATPDTPVTHPTEEALVLARWDEGDAAAVRAHLLSCPDCCARDAEVAAVLAAVSTADSGSADSGSDAPLAEAYAEALWARLAPRLSSPQPQARRFRLPSRFPIRSVAMPLAAAALLVLAFLAGRNWPAGRGAPAAAGVDAKGSSGRVLLVAVSDHLERSQILLLELANAPAGDAFDATAEKSRAADLVLSSRLLRQSAARSGDPFVAGVLDDLERVLLDVARGPARMDEPELDTLRKRIEAQGLLFKVRVIGSRVRGQESSSRQASPERNRT